jgi:hypothetical protein
MKNKVKQPKKTKLEEVPWLGLFRITENGQLMKKTAILKGDKVGAFNPFGDIIYFPKNLKVIYNGPVME